MLAPHRGQKCEASVVTAPQLLHLGMSSPARVVRWPTIVYQRVLAG
jgi:hypothetical protein